MPTDAFDQDWNAPLNPDHAPPIVDGGVDLPDGYLDDAELDGFHGGFVTQGIVGFALVTLVWLILGFLFPVLTEFTSSMFRGLPSFAVQAIFAQAMFFPPAIACGVATAVPLLIDRSIVLRFLLCCLMSAPGFIGFAIGAKLVDRHIDGEFYLTLTAYPATIAICVVIMQLFSGRSLIHLLDENSGRSTLGIRALMELTAVFGVLMAIAMAFETEGIWIGYLAFAILGVFTALVMYFSAWCFLDEKIRWFWSLSIAAGLAYVTSFFWLLFFLSQGFTQNITETDLFRIGAFAMIGTAVVYGMQIFCFSILRRTGWRFVKRKSRSVV